MQQRGRMRWQCEGRLRWRGGQQEMMVWGRTVGLRALLLMLLMLMLLLLLLLMLMLLMLLRGESLRRQ